MNLKRFSLFVLILFSVFLIGACGDMNERETENGYDSENNQHMTGDKAHNDANMDANKDVQNAIAVLSPTKGNDVSGVVKFTKTDGGIKITADVQGLTPGKHGFHIHQYGDCSAEDGTSAGGHFAPRGHKHGAPEDQDRHVGDLNNITAESNGNASYERVDSVITFAGKNSIIGKAVIIHAGEDDLKSQPTGAAGARVACGVIGVAK